MAGRRVLLIIGGGIAAYKSLELIRELARRGISTRCILTRAAKEFVTPLSVAALSGEKVYDDLFSLTDETEMGHIELSRSADLIVVAPATADLMAKAAVGLAGDMATTALLATDKPVMIAPAMNVRMWEHPATQRNLAILQGDGVEVVGPDEGDMACGEFGAGRMAEPLHIALAIERFFTDRDAPILPKPLAGRSVIVTAGATREAIDPVRYLSNHSSGRQGYAIAEALAAAGASVRLVTGPSELAIPKGVTGERIESARDMLAACEAALATGPVDAFIAVAAVADWRPADTAALKIKKGASGDAPAPLALVENPDILKTIARRRKNRPYLVVGFAAETNDVIAHARAKLAKKGCDWIVANDVSGDVMGGTQNAVTLVTPEGEETWPRQSKTAVAERLTARIAQALGQAASPEPTKSG